MGRRSAATLPPRLLEVCLSRDGHRPHEAGVRPETRGACRRQLWRPPASHRVPGEWSRPPRSSTTRRVPIECAITAHGRSLMVAVHITWPTRSTSDVDRMQPVSPSKWWARESLTDAPIEAEKAVCRATVASMTVQRFMSFAGTWCGCRLSSGNTRPFTDKCGKGGGLYRLVGGPHGAIAGVRQQP